MSRSFKEWARARDQWRVDQGLRKSSLNPPSPNSIVYMRESTNPYWSDAYSYVNKNFTFTFRDNKIETFIREAAIYEHEKELDFLKKFYRNGTSGESEIDMFNNLFLSREIYQKYNERIKDILQNKQFQENKDQSSNKYFRGLAPNLSSVFAGYLKTHLAAELSNWWTVLDPQMSTDALAAEFQTRLYNAALAASEQMANIPEIRDNGYGSGAEWRPVLEALQMVENESKEHAMRRNAFMSTLNEALGYRNIEKLIEDMRERKANNKRAAIKTGLSKTLKINQKARIGGSIAEPVAAMLAAAINGADNADFNFSVLNFGSNMRTTDVMMLFSMDMSLDLTEMIQSLESATSSGNSNQIRQVYEKIRNWYIEQDWEGKLEELYLVYTNAKNYGIGAGGSDYTKTYNGTLEELPSFLSANGIDIGSASEFLSFIYNTASGAINSNKSWAAWRYTTNALKAAAAKIMFDDYSSFGQGDEHAIHMYYLSGKYLPASYVLNAMADAAADANETIDARVSLPDGIKDYGPKWSNLRGAGTDSSDAAFKEALRNYWDDEYERIRNTGNWSVSFTLRIKALLGGSF